MIPRRSLLALFMLGAVAACDEPAATATTPVASSTDLAGTNWRIYSIAGVKVEDEAATRLSFDASTVSGSFGCNSFTAPYSTADGLLRVGPAALTRMACAGAAARQERSGMEQLALPMQVVPNGASQLVLSGRQGQSFILNRQ